MLPGGRSRRGSTFQLTVTANVRASVSITNPAVKGFASLTGNTTFVQALAPGKYTVKVTAPGYTPQTKAVDLSANQTVDFQLQPALVRLKVTSNVNGSLVQFSGAGTASGNAPFQKDMIPGNYTVSISANGYVPQSRAVNLQTAQNVHFNLEKATVSLNITSNVSGAKVQISNPAVKGSASSGTIPFQKNLVLGNYTITVSAGGYVSQTKSLDLTRDTNFHFDLKPAMGTVQVMVAPDSLNKSDIYARDKIQIIDNGIEMESLSFQLRPGQHTLQIVSGGLWTQTTINIEAGKTYTLQPVLSLKVIQ
ncbi:MAG: PEGA domain-containing protein [Spirochaetia bacterium]|nr:PEGA domain-containing protein [Spirochaetia bacterium]